MRHESLQNTGPTCCGTETCEASERITSRTQMLLQEAFPARISALLVRGLASPGHDPASGVSSTASFANFDPATCSWRTSQLSFIEDLGEFLETWPQAGMTQSGQCYQRAPWVRHIHESGCSLWPTVLASEGTGGGSKRMAEQALRGQKRASGHKTELRIRDLIQYLHGGPMNLAWAEWLMGFPPGWTDLKE
jgi:hypothetical protein